MTNHSSIIRDVSYPLYLSSASGLYTTEFNAGHGHVNPGITPVVRHYLSPFSRVEPRLKSNMHRSGAA